MLAEETVRMFREWAADRTRPRPTIRSLAARFSGAAVPEAPTLASGRLLLRLLRRALAGWLNRLAGRAGHD